MCKTLVLSPFYRWRNWGTEGKITCPASHREQVAESAYTAEQSASGPPRVTGVCPASSMNHWLSLSTWCWVVCILTSLPSSKGRAAHTRFLPFFISHSLFYPLGSGFCPHHSLETRVGPPYPQIPSCPQYLTNRGSKIFEKKRRKFQKAKLKFATHSATIYTAFTLYSVF